MTKITTSWITITATDETGSFKCYVAEPAGDTAAPAIIAIQEIFGVNAGMREIAETLARSGYRAFVPDLFWRQEPGVELTDKEQAHWDKAFKLFGGFDVDKGIEDINATIGAARTRGAAKVGSVGYCLGGKLAYLTAARTDADCSVSYYGVGIADMLDEAANIKNPLLMHIAGLDEFVPADQQAAMHKGLDDHGKVTLFDYPEADHAFARPDGIHHKADDAETANTRTAAFFKTHLG